MRKQMIVWLAATAMLLFSDTAHAHVTVAPKETTQGAYEKFTVRVPTEKDVPTVKVELKIPADVNISLLEPKPGWTYELEKDSAGKISSIVWKASGEGLSPAEFGEFNIQGKVGDNASQIVWKAYQTYKDGSVVEWTGAPDAKTPASVTAIKPKPAGGAADSHDHPAAAADTASQPAERSGSLALYMSAGALLLSAISLLLTIFRRKAG